MVQVLVAGAAGRMGQQIIKTIQQMPNLRLTGAFEAEGHASIGRDAGEICGLGRLGVPISAGLKSVLAQGDVLRLYLPPGKHRVCAPGGGAGPGHGCRHHRPDWRGRG